MPVSPHTSLQHMSEHRRAKGNTSDSAATLTAWIRLAEAHDPMAYSRDRTLVKAAAADWHAYVKA